MSRDPLLYLDELIEAAQRACEFGHGLERERYQPGGMAFEAIIRQIEIIGKAAAHIPEELQADAPEIPWGNLIGMRNRLIHGYFAIDPDIVWSVVQDKLPALLPPLKKLLASLS
jgi:uncharacterized protein with HEPN domain